MDISVMGWLWKCVSEVKLDVIHLIMPGSCAPDVDDYGVLPQ